MISLEDVRKLHSFFDEELKRYQKQFNKNEMEKQPYGFAAYIRKAFEQKREFNPDAILDFFNNENREKLENSVISYLG